VIDSALLGGAAATSLQAASLLFSAFWHSSLLLVAAALLVWAFRRRSAALRQRIWVAAILLVPVATAVGELTGRVDLVHRSVLDLSAPLREIRKPVLDSSSEPEDRDEMASPAGASTQARSALASPDGVDLPKESATIRARNLGAVPRATSIWAAVVAGYGLVAASLLALIAAQVVRIRSWLWRGRIVTDARVNGALQMARRRMGIERGCIAVRPRDLDAPFTLRTLHPVVVVSEGLAEELASPELDALMIHELAHVKRNDPLTFTAISVVRALLWFQPLIWIGAREAAILAEQAADDAVLASGTPPSTYARMLARLTERLAQRRVWTELAVGVVFSKGALLRRVEAILSTSGERVQGWSVGSAVASAIGLLAATATAVAFPLVGPSSADITHRRGMIVRHVESFPPSGDLSGDVSQNGRYISFVDWTFGNLALYDVDREASRLLTTNSSWESVTGWVEKSTISPDAARVAYSWVDDRLGRYQLRIVGVDGSSDRLVFDDPDVFWIRPYGWSPDGEEVLACLETAERSVRDGTGDWIRSGSLVLITVDGGTTRYLRTWHRRGVPTKAAVSPDGRFVAYDLPQEGDPERHDVFVVSRSGGAERSIVHHVADDRLVSWTSDGTGILFVSDRSSRPALWSVTVSEGEPDSLPILLQRDFEGRALGLTDDGRLFHVASASRGDIFLAELDATTGRLQLEPRIANTSHVGSSYIADWSPDGRQLLFRVDQTGLGAGPESYGAWGFVTLDLDTGEETMLELSTPLHRPSRLRGPRLSPDGLSLLFLGHTNEEGMGLYVVDRETGESRKIATLPVFHIRGRPAWSPDGRWVYWFRGDALIRVDPVTGSEKVLHRHARYPSGLEASPDGRWLALWRGEGALLVVPTAGGSAREVLRLIAEEQSDTKFVAWTPDSRYLLFSKRDRELWRADATTGSQQHTGLTVEGRLLQVSVHSDGEQMVFSEYRKRSELWVMEGFLPESGGAVPAGTGGARR